MKIVLFCDMEGASGVWREEQVTYDSSCYREACHYMTQDVNACIQGCIDGGADRIIVRDVHAKCCNIIWEELDSRAEYLAVGDPGKQRFESVAGCDGLILLGYHAMAGTARGILAHTASTLWQNCWINGKKVGEVALDAARAGEYGVPVIMASGDDKLCAEARATIKDIVAVQVKTGLARESARLLPMANALQKIHDGALQAVKKCRRIKPVKIKPPIRLQLEYFKELPVAYRGPEFEIIDGRTCALKGRNVEEAVNALIY